MKHPNAQELETGLAHILESPLEEGVVELIARRPETDQREILDNAQFDETEGLVGDNWIMRGSGKTADGSAHPEMQVNIMNSRVIDLVARSRERWALAGDQLFVDLNLKEENVPAGTQLKLGEVVLEVTPMPHLGCHKFTDRFGIDAMEFVNSARGRALHLRGVNARVIKGGTVATGDVIRKLP